MSQTAVRLGLVGLGNIARQHLANLRQGLVENCRVTALCSRRKDELASRLNVPHFTSVEALVASGECDAVLVATPTWHHYEAGACALSGGLHVMMEKPLGLSLQEGESLLALQGEHQVFAVMLNQRADPLFQTMQACIADGGLGVITRTHWTMTNWFRPEVYFQVSDWRATWRGEGGGLLLNQCIHNLDIFQWLCGMPERVEAFCGFGRYHAIEVEDEATAFFRYPGAATGVFVGSTGEAPGVNRLDIVGDAGSLHYNGERLVYTRNSPATSEYSRSTHDMFGLPESHSSDITPERGVNQHALLLSNFAAAIRNGDALIAPAREGLSSLALANAMLLSAWQEEAVALPLDSERYQRELDAKIAQSALREKSDVQANIDMSASYR